jgi:hypothetical protein
VAKRWFSKVERAGAVLSRWLRNHGRDGDVREHTIRLRWPELVGEQIAQRTQPTTLKDGLLTVSVANAAWLNELTFMRGAILHQINDLVGQATVKAIRLVAGRIRPTPPPPAAVEVPPAVELPADEVERIERELAASEVEDPELLEAIRRARLAQLGRLLRFKD